MKTNLIFLFFVTLFASRLAEAQPKVNTPYYEMRVCWAAEGKLPDLLEAYQENIVKLLEKHHIKSVGYWVPADNKENKLVCLFSYPSVEARETAWKNMGKDPAWKKTKLALEPSGLVTKIESSFFLETDYSPADFSSQVGRVFELRIYTTTPYNLGLLNARFRNHTLALFSKYGMTNLLYMTPVGKDNNLTYFLSHASAEAAKASFTAFVADEGWKKAKDASELLANGPITSDIKSEFLMPTDFSPWR
jgi:hypothetical protein